MAEEFCGGANWWESPSAANRSRFDCGGSGGGSSTSSTTTTVANGGAACGYGWLTDSTTARSSLDSEIPATSSTLQLVGLGLSSQSLDWNQQPLLRNPEKADSSFRAMLQEGMGMSPNFPQDQTSGVFGSQLQWRDKLFGTTSEDQASMESTVTCHQQGFQLDSTSSSTLYGATPTTTPSTILQGFIGSDQQTQQPMNYQQNYLALDSQTQSRLPASWANKVPQFLRSTPANPFPNAASYLNADVRPTLMANSLQQQPQVSIPGFEEKPKLQNTMEVRETSSSTGKKGGTENNTKRARSDTATSTMPPFKVRKEKMGDRITALQQLVSPFGKTDTASVLSEAIEYIRFLHEQVSVLSTPYLKSGAASFPQQQQGGEKAKVDPDAPKQDLRSRGLCLVPVSSTFPVTHESTVDYWTPTFGGTFR